ncbi:unnamed protein product [Mytilus coruscus]|uniref:Uncharacterized protein n=1 Tax=Mytilus coruscus TaxID=42192 RepID=A0A6J8EB18_MYTCO|nr:unnamed protein product [Mytilus coruscus]
MIRWNGNIAKCINPKFIQMEHTTGAFIPSESHRGETLQRNMPSLTNFFDKVWYFVSSAVLYKSYGNQEYQEEDEDEESDDDNDLYICGLCKCEMTCLLKFVRHKRRCKRNRQGVDASHPDENFEGTGSGEYNVEIIIENVNDEWTENAVKKKMKLQKQSRVGFRLTHKEKGSLNLWTKISAMMLKDEDIFMRCLEQFLTMILRQFPLEIQTYAEIRINITIVEWYKDLVVDDYVMDETNEPDEKHEFQRETNVKQLVAAIDFGTTYSGYAHCLRSDYMSDKKKLELKFPDWKIGDGRASYIVVLFDTYFSS